MFSGNTFVFVLCAALFATAVATIDHDDYREIVNQVLAEHKPKLDDSQMLKLAHASLIPEEQHDPEFIQALEKIDAELKNKKGFEPKWLTQFLNEQVLKKAKAHNNNLSGEVQEQAQSLHATLHKVHNDNVVKVHQEHGVNATLEHAANPADPLRNPRSTKVANSEKQISKLVNNFVEVDRADRQRLPYLRSLQFHLAKFYTPAAAADDNPENEGNDESQEEEE
ncbi:hypothetical protein DdX_15021 [Ditylenchus destructor]|uniref:Uncharacterized protein n=1 Tax=Ditylenchus destructor TaxID=166010 RepID=A0AAD4MRS5_9BILA|nr:hypothetical protein DdX_15021 [Ditylenchus destructor]